MKITVNKENTIQLEEVFNPVVLKTSAGEEMTICMRDSGFEFKYQGEWYSAKEGVVNAALNQDINSDKGENIDSVRESKGVLQ